MVSFVSASLDVGKLVRADGVNPTKEFSDNMTLKIKNSYDKKFSKSLDVSKIKINKVYFFGNLVFTYVNINGVDYTIISFNN